MKRLTAAAAVFLGSALLWGSDVTVARSVAVQGVPKYADGFEHFDYANPGAPKGGTLRRGTTGTWDNFNRYASRGVSGAGAGDLFYDTLMAGSLDEADVYYPLVAEKVEYPRDFSWIIFHIDPRVRSRDGVALTARDAAFSFEKFMAEGVPQFRMYYKDVKAVVLDDRRVRFELPVPDRSMALSLAGLKMLPKHWWSSRNLADPLTEVPMGSGPYTVSDYKIGQYLVYERVKEYWAADLPVNRGLNNFDYIRFEYYRDDTVAFEAFKAGEYDFYLENIAKNWATLYTGKQFERGLIKRETIPDLRPQGMSAFTFNTERAIFSDRRVREAVGCAMDFEWMNKNFFYGQYVRSRSYFTNTPYEARGLPTPAELAILEPIRESLDPRVFTEEYRPPETAGTGNIRPQMREALRLFREAGWEIDAQGKMRSLTTGEQFRFELLVYSPAMERIASPLKRNLERMGILMDIRIVDTTQYTNRMRNRDFDLIDQGYGALYYPSTDLELPWKSAYIDSTYNLAGVRDPAIDYLVDGIVANQENPEALLAWGHALDRALTWNFYVIPRWHLAQYRVAYWDRFDRPATPPRYDLGLDSWWFDPERDRLLRGGTTGKDAGGKPAKGASK